MSHVVAAPAALDPARVPQPVLDILRALRDGGHQAWLAGGGVRDLFLGRPVADWDVATDARPVRVQALFPRTAPTGIEHGTVTVLVEEGRGREQAQPAVRAEPAWAGGARLAEPSTSGRASEGERAVQTVEVTTFRGEGPYLDGRRPSSVTFLDDVTEDLARRDFTVNAMAWDPLAGKLCDPFGGREDLARRRIVAVGDPHLRFGEDGLRPLRAVRFASTLGFAIERHTRAAIVAAREVYQTVALERVRDELGKILVGPEPARGLDLMRLLGLLARPMPELIEGAGFRQNKWHRWDVWRHTMIALRCSRPDLTVRLAVLLHDVAKPRCAQEVAPGEHTFYNHEFVGADLAREIVLRLRWPTHLADRVALLVREHNWYYRAEWNDGTVRRYLARIGAENFGLLCALREADLLARGRAVAAGLTNLVQLRARFEAEMRAEHALRVSDLALGGREVMETLGVPPGPHVGEALRALLELVLDDPSQNSAERLRALLRERAERPAKDNS